MMMLASPRAGSPDRPRLRLPPQVRVQQILDGALEVFNDKGYAAARMDDIASRCGLSKGGLYAHFDSKEQVFAALLASALQPTHLVSPPDSHAPDEALVDWLLDSLYACFDQPRRRAVLTTIPSDSHSWNLIFIELLLREHGFECREGVIWYAGSRERAREYVENVGVSSFRLVRAATGEAKACAAILPTAHMFGGRDVPAASIAHVAIAPEARGQGLAVPLMQALVTDDMSEWGDLLYPMLARRCSVYVHRAVDDISFAALNATHARLLGPLTGKQECHLPRLHNVSPPSTVSACPTR